MGKLWRVDKVLEDSEGLRWVRGEKAGSSRYTKQRRSGVLGNRLYEALLITVSQHFEIEVARN
jgi:hypothetical protein